MLAVWWLMPLLAPSFAAPSPPAPSPYPPGSLCTNSCQQLSAGAIAYNGECEDGGEASSSSACAIGTDCFDCGLRPSGAQQWAAPPPPRTFPPASPAASGSVTAQVPAVQIQLFVQPIAPTAAIRRSLIIAFTRLANCTTSSAEASCAVVVRMSNKTCVVVGSCDEVHIGITYPSIVQADAPTASWATGVSGLPLASPNSPPPSPRPAPSPVPPAWDATYACLCTDPSRPRFIPTNMPVGWSDCHTTFHFESICTRPRDQQKYARDACCRSLTYGRRLDASAAQEDSAPPPLDLLPAELHSRRALQSGATTATTAQTYQSAPAATVARDAMLSYLASTTDLEADLRAAGMSSLVNLDSTRAPTYTGSIVIRAVFVSPPAPAMPPPPPMPPNPPSPPPGLCENTCKAGQPGVCNDGGPEDPTANSGNAGQRALCEAGTDCADCGVRTFCTTCPTACMAANRQGSQACLESAYKNGLCDAACNNVACGYDGGDCTTSQIQTTCEKAVEEMGVDYQPPPLCVSGGASGGCSGTKVPLDLQLQLEQLRLQLNSELNEMVMSFEFEYITRWQDSRLFTHPCTGVLSSTLSMSKAQGKSDLTRANYMTKRANYWTPSLAVGDLVPGYDQWEDEVQATLDAAGNWSVPSPSTNSTECRNCVSFQIESEAQVLMSQMPKGYWYFPFDQHTLSIQIEVPGTHIFTCTDELEKSLLAGMMDPSAETPLTDDSASSLLLPLTGEWLLEPSMPLFHREAAGAESLSRSATLLDRVIDIYHPKSDGVADVSKCVVHIYVKRNYFVFTVKWLLLMISIVFFSIVVSMYMHPVELVGDRAALLIVAMLIVSTMIQTDIGLGRLSSLLWVDVPWCRVIEPSAPRSSCHRPALCCLYSLPSCLPACLPLTTRMRSFGQWFNLMQMLLLIIPLLETMAMHYLAATDQDRWAIDLDRQLRRLIPLLYVVVVVTGFLIVLKQERPASIVAAISFPLIGLVGLVQIMQVGGRTKRMKQSSIAALVRTPVENEDRFEACASKVFHAFDVDVSTAGTLEVLPNSVPV